MRKPFMGLAALEAIGATHKGGSLNPWRMRNGLKRQILKLPL
jgi:hypothetical protein